MVFTILIWISVIVVLLGVLAAVVSVFVYSQYGDAFGFLILSFIVGAIPLLVCIHSWGNHAEDLAIIETQSRVVDVYEGRVKDLTERLNSFNYPSGALVNADTPVASIVASLTNAESQLATAKEMKVGAMRRIEARARGPMSDVIKFVGE